MKKEIPILFSTPMVKAVVEDRKTKTRRIIKDLIIDDESGNAFFGKHQMDIHRWKEEIFNYCPYGISEDLVWMRENFRIVAWDFDDGEMMVEYTDGIKKWVTMYDPGEDNMWMVNHLEKLENKGIIEPIPGDDNVIDEESAFKFTGKNHPWTPSIHMPKCATRQWLGIVSIKIERLHDITLEDMQAEGVIVNVSSENKVQWHLGMENSALSFLTIQTKGKTEGEWTWYDVYFAHWAALWSKINGRESWDSNPWVWVIEFKKVDHASV